MNVKAIKPYGWLNFNELLDKLIIYVVSRLKFYSDDILASC